MLGYMMTKKTSVKQVPMKEYFYYDYASGQTIRTGLLRHLDFEGESIWDHTKNAYKPNIMIDNVPFSAIMTYDGYYRGRSAAGMTFKDEKGIPYTVFLTDFEKFIPIMDKGVVTGTFIYCKRGRNYGIKLYE
jgi:hypothetical protein